MPTYQTNNSLARTSPLRSIPVIRPAGATFRMSDQAKAEWALQIACRDVPALEKRYAVYCAALGGANRLRGPMRRHWQAKALRQINAARAQLRAARKALVAAEAAMLQFAVAA